MVVKPLPAIDESTPFVPIASCAELAAPPSPTVTVCEPLEPVDVDNDNVPVL